LIHPFDELFENGEIDIDELDDVLAAQLGSLKWTLDSRGRIKIESKEDMRKRGIPSPGGGRHDCQDVLTTCAGRLDQRRESRRRKHHRGFDDEGLVTPSQRVSLIFPASLDPPRLDP
jgi:hypothetical protein